jgi:hypothetical protein
VAKAARRRVSRATDSKDNNRHHKGNRAKAKANKVSRAKASKDKDRGKAKDSKDKATARDSSNRKRTVKAKDKATGRDSSRPTVARRMDPAAREAERHNSADACHRKMRSSSVAKRNSG